MPIHEEAEERLTAAVHVDRATLHAWGELFRKNPAEAFDWSINTVRAAARVDVFERVLNTKLADDNLIEFVRNEALKGAEFPQRSTSPMSDAMHQERTAAWASAFHILESGW